MDELEKATLAILVANELLHIGKKILAIKIIRFMYSTNLPEGKSFVDMIESIKQKAGE